MSGTRNAETAGIRGNIITITEKVRLHVIAVPALILKVISHETNWLYLHMRSLLV